MKTTWFKSGDWNAICDVCGFKHKASELKARWDGLMTCPRCWETRHPQEFLRAIPDQQKLPWTRPEAVDQFVTLSNGCSVIGMQGVAGVGIAGCMIAGRDLGIRSTLSEIEDFH
jgi:hypothetical protein